MLNKLFIFTIFLSSNLLFANPIDSMNENIVKLDKLNTEQNQKHKQNIGAKVDTLTQKAQSLFLIRQNNELILNEQKIGATNGE